MTAMIIELFHRSRGIIWSHVALPNWCLAYVTHFIAIGDGVASTWSTSARDAIMLCNTATSGAYIYADYSVLSPPQQTVSEHASAHTPQLIPLGLYISRNTVKKTNSDSLRVSRFLVVFFQMRSSVWIFSSWNLTVWLPKFIVLACDWLA